MQLCCFSYTPWDIINCKICPNELKAAPLLWWNLIRLQLAADERGGGRRKRQKNAVGEGKEREGGGHERESNESRGRERTRQMRERTERRTERRPSQRDRVETERLPLKWMKEKNEGSYVISRSLDQIPAFLLPPENIIIKEWIIDAIHFF